VGSRSARAQIINIRRRYDFVLHYKAAGRRHFQIAVIIIRGARMGGEHA
jgi:hypothetical protein